MKLVKSALVTAALAISAIAASPAHAALSIGKIPGTATANNDFINLFLGAGTSIEGFYGAQLYLVGGAATVTVEYFGAEAGFANTFLYGPANQCSYAHAGGNTFVNTAGGASVGAEDIVKPNCSLATAPGLLPFRFGTPTLPAINGSNTNGTTSVAPNFFVTFDSVVAGRYIFDTNVNGVTPGGGQSVFLFLDDDGAGPDDNHDDTVVRLSLTCVQGQTCGFQVPEPGSLALVGLALLGAGVARRKIQA